MSGYLVEVVGLGDVNLRSRQRIALRRFQQRFQAPIVESREEHRKLSGGAVKTCILLLLVASTHALLVGCDPPPLDVGVPPDARGRGPSNAAHPGQQTFAGWTPDGARHNSPVAPLFQALDVDHDQILSPEEIADSPKQISLLDRNQDGVLVQDEITGWLRAEQQSHASSFPASWEEDR